MQVYLGNRRVGEAKLSPRPGQNVISVQVIDGPVFASPGEELKFEPVREIRLKVEWAHFRIDRMTEHTYGPEHVAAIFNKHGILPSDCQKEERIEADATIYRYKVLKVNKDQLEEIFDFDWFEPADGPVDREYLQERRDRMMNSHFGV
jgi:hypothetical protein